MCGELPAPELFKRQEQSSKIRRRFNLSGTTPICGSFEDDSPLTSLPTRRLWSTPGNLLEYLVLLVLFLLLDCSMTQNFCQLQTVRTGFEMLGDRGDPNSGPLFMTMYLINLLSCCKRRTRNRLDPMDVGRRSFWRNNQSQ